MCIIMLLIGLSVIIITFVAFVRWLDGVSKLTKIVWTIDKCTIMMVKVGIVATQTVNMVGI